MDHIKRALQLSASLARRCLLGVSCFACFWKIWIGMVCFWRKFIFLAFWITVAAGVCLTSLMMETNSNNLFFNCHDFRCDLLKSQVWLERSVLQLIKSLLCASSFCFKVASHLVQQNLLHRLNWNVQFSKHTGQTSMAVLQRSMNKEKMVFHFLHFLWIY